MSNFCKAIVSRKASHDSDLGQACEAHLITHQGMAGMAEHFLLLAGRQKQGAGAWRGRQLQGGEGAVRCGDELNACELLQGLRPGSVNV